MTTASNSKPGNDNLMTSPGYFRFPYLNTVDDFKGAKNYKTDFSVDPDAEAANIAIIEEACEATYQKSKAELQQALTEAKTPKQKAAAEEALKNLTKRVPVSPEYNQEGEETGRVILKFKNTPSYTTKSGKVIDNRPALFDASGAPCKVVVTHGSQGKLSFYLSPYCNGPNAGVVLRMKAAQVIRLGGGGQKSAEQFGFQAVEGFSAANADPFPTSGPDDAGDNGPGANIDPDDDHAF